MTDEVKFHWYAGATISALIGLTGIPIREFNLNPEAGIELYRKGRPLVPDVFGPDVDIPGVSTPHISYGHANGLGAGLLFPEDGEVGHKHIYESLGDGIDALKKPVDFAKAGMAPFYVDYRKTLEKAFPGEQVVFGYGLEGPITTGYELRGDGFFYDVMDQPETVNDFLELVTASIVQFHCFRCNVLGEPGIGNGTAGMADDISSLIPPRMFPDMVVPRWEQYYSGMTTGGRHAHIENLSVDHLEHLEVIGLSSYDPSISPKLNPKIISERCRVPFTWLLGGFHYAALSPSEVKDFVFQSAADGAGGVVTYVEQCMCDDKTPEKVGAFIEAGMCVERMFREGATAQDVGGVVSKEGREKFWGQWPE